MAQETTENTGKKQHRSKGETMFDWLIYGGMNFIGTFLITIPVAYSLEMGFMRKPFAAFRNGIAKLGASEGTANMIAKTTSLFAGGTVMLLPVKIAEDNKKEIVDKLNKSLGDTTNPNTIESAPKQDWLSLAKSRLVAWGTVFVSMTTVASLAGKDKDGVSRFAKFEDWFGRKTAEFFKKDTHREQMTNLTDRKMPDATSLSELRKEEGVIKGVLKDVEAGAKKVLGHDVKASSVRLDELAGKIAKHETRTFSYGKLASLDIFATAAAVSLLYAGSRVFGKVNEPKTTTERLPALHEARAVKEIPATNERPAVSEEPKPTFAERIAHEKKEANESIGVAHAV